MPEFRQNPVTGQWVIIAPERAKRPQEFRSKPPEHRAPVPSAPCVFCPGQEQMTPPEVYAVRDDPGTANREGWRVRVVPNKYPMVAIGAEDPSPPECDAVDQPAGIAASGLRRSVAGVGMHEVIVESPAHGVHFAFQDERQAERIVGALRHRFRMVVQAREVKFVCILKNHGHASGASIEHPHFQLVATAVIPPVIKTMVERQAAYEEAQGRALFDVLLEEELACGDRVVAETDGFVAVAPWASQLPYELWVVPREPAAMFGEVSDRGVASLAAILRDCLRRLHDLLDNPDYHLVIHSGPKWELGRAFHRWFVQVSPQVVRPAAFEFGTNMAVNQVPPEGAAASLRAVC